MWISITELTKRSGVAASALRFYESGGLIQSARLASGRRQFKRETLRRVAFILAAQRIGLSLHEIKSALASLPEQRTPTTADWEKLSRAWRPLLDEKIKSLTTLRDQLNQCIGCGCLSLKACALYNPGDAAGIGGNGARFLLGERSKDVIAAAKKIKKQITS
jgi:MerR family transcriptional regulator, redox-sensitive transcriptional activator SoxR